MSEEIEKEIISFKTEQSHRLWFCNRMIFILKKRRSQLGIAEFFYFLANISFLTIGIVGLAKTINHSCNWLRAVAFIASFIIGSGMLLLSTNDHFLIKDLHNNMKIKKNKTSDNEGTTK